MGSSRTSIVIAVLIASLTMGSTTMAAVPRHPSAVRVSGVVRPDRPLLRLDPLSPWLLARPDAPAPLLTPGRLVDPLIDPLAVWRVDETVAGVHRWRGGRFEGPLDLGDTRLVGWLSLVWSTDIHRLRDASASVHVVTARLETGSARWSGTLSGTGDPATGSFQIHGWLDGTGTSAGGRLIVDIRCVGQGAMWRVDGLAVMGDPPAPEPVVG